MALEMNELELVNGGNSDDLDKYLAEMHRKYNIPDDLGATLWRTMTDEERAKAVELYKQ